MSIPAQEIIEKARKIEEARSALQKAESDFEAFLKGVGNQSHPRATRKRGGAKRRGRRPAREDARAVKEAPKVVLSPENNSGDHQKGRRNEMPLTKMIPTQVLKKRANGMTHDAIVEDVLGRGYQHASGDFSNVVYQTIRKLVREEKIAELEVEDGKDPVYILPEYVDV